MATVLLRLRTLYGGGLLLAPAGSLAALARMPLGPGTIAVARVLGARHLVQAWLIRHPSRRRLFIGAGVDAAHAVSMMALARCSADPGHRVAARRDARTAAALAAEAGPTGQLIYWTRFPDLAGMVAAVTVPECSRTCQCNEDRRH